MDNSLQNSVASNTSSAVPIATTPADPLSPWQEELPPVETKEQVVGTLGSQPAQTADKQADSAKPFVLPNNIDDLTVKTPAAATVSPTLNAQTSDPASAQASGGFTYPSANLQSGADAGFNGNGAQNELAAPVAQTNNAVEDIFDLSDNDTRSIGADIASAPNTLPKNSKSFSALSAPAGQNPSLAGNQPFGVSPSNQPNQNSQNAALAVAQAQTSVQPIPIQPMQGGQTPTVSAPKTNRFAGLFKKTSANQAVSPTTPIPTPQNVPGVNARAGFEEMVAPKKAISFPKPLLAIFAIIALLGLGVWLTELGILSIGLEKVYGAVGAEQLWGGLSSKPDKAIARSFSVMKSKQSIGVKGTISMTINKNSESPITTPLVSVAGGDINLIGKPQKAVLASNSDSVDSLFSTDDEFTVDDSDSAPDDGSTASDESSSTSSSASDSSDESSIDSSADGTEQTDVDQESQTGYSDQSSATTKDIAITLDSTVSSKGNEATLDIQRSVGSSKVMLRSKGDKLWVLSDEIKFDENSERGKWLEYNLADSQNIIPDFFGLKSAEGFSVDGQRAGSEKIGGVNCYKYEIKNLELGDTLSVFGIKSELIQSISGNIWIGIKDKLTYKINLEVTPSPSLSIAALTINVNFGNFDKDATFSQPLSSDIISELAGTPSQDGATLDSSTDTGDSTAGSVLTGDARRKADLKSIKDALTNYKAKFGVFPVSPTYTNLNTSSNAITSALVPMYLTSLPQDPKAADGWYYGYKSADGSAFSLSARLEDVTDTAGKLIDGLCLYFVNNQ